MNQQDLFEKYREPMTESAPYQAHSETSRAAADRIGPKLNERQRQVYEFIVSRGDRGATSSLVNAVLNKLDQELR